MVINSLIAAAMSATAKLATATVVSVSQETPTVKGLRLQLAAPSSIAFQPGQWVDFHVPGLKAVGGYSICSTPSQLQQQGIIELCVKSSRHPCAQWVHNQAVAGTQVSVQVGGSFVLEPSSSSGACLFVAGGIGITALSSMVLSLVEQQQQLGQAGSEQQRPFLLYSASAPDEFALLRQLLPLHRSGSLDLQLHTTQSHGLVVAEDAAHSPQVVQGRVCEQHLATALKQLQSGSSSGMQDIAAYVCGPPKMTDNVVHMLFGLGLPEAAVHTERWW